MSKITDKYAKLLQQGIDFGRDLHSESPDLDAGYGGSYREYQNGNIYFHPQVSSDAHEVHGGILSLYLAKGGPGIDPQSGKRLFGFPLTDELMASSRTPASRFEWASIYWTQDTGGVTLTGPAFQTFARHGGIGVLGLPITSNVAVNGGEAIYCERGVAWSDESFGGNGLIGLVSPPLLGTPKILDPTVTKGQVSSTTQMLVRIGDTITAPVPMIPPFMTDVIGFETVPQALLRALELRQADFFQALWAGRLSLVKTGTPYDERKPSQNRLALDCVVETTTTTPLGTNVTCRLSVRPDAAIEDSTLYDLEFALPQAAEPKFYPLSPHAVYFKKDWSNFGLLHITDVHLSLRNQQLRAKLEALGHHDGAANYANCQDQFRDFVRYANHLHSLGLAHAIMATGDLVDYIAEQGDDPLDLSNYGRFRNMILGRPFAEGSAATEELLLPIFTTFGNHDHRLYPYDLHCKLSINNDVFEAAILVAPISPPLAASLTLLGIIDEVRSIFTGKDFLTFDQPQFETFNLKESEVTDLQHGIPVYDALQFNIPLSFLKQATTYPYWDRYFGARNNLVALGPHRIVMLDSGGDSGVPQSAGPADLPGIVLNYIDGNLPRDTIELTTGAPNSIGYDQGQLNLLSQAMIEAGPAGLVIVGVHLPPVAPIGGYNDHYRETEHPHTDPSFIANYVAKNKLDPAEWSLSGTPYFMTGDVRNNLDFGIGTGREMTFLKLCAGVGTPRPIDLLLCGHHHDRVEYRIKWDPTTSKLHYFTDFYSENPHKYYASTRVSRTQVVNPTTGNFKIKYQDNAAKVTVEQGAVVGGELGPGLYIPGAGQPGIPFTALRTPPYADPLNSSDDPAAWWNAHRPLIMQTAALGPIDPVQRFDKPTVPEPTFQGFRLVQVRSNVIQKIRYVTMLELRSSSFVLPWEAGSRPGPTTNIPITELPILSATT